jgi:hypothetical protein
MITAVYSLRRINLSCMEGDCYSGYGVYTYNNTIYTGFFEGGYREGYGIEKYPDNCSYTGFFLGGHKEFFGRYDCPLNKYSFDTIWHNNGYIDVAYYRSGNNVYFGKWVDGILCLTGTCKNGKSTAILPFKRILKTGIFVNYHIEGYGEERDALDGRILYRGNFVFSHREDEYVKPDITEKDIAPGIRLK